MVRKSQPVGGKPAGYLQEWPRIWLTWDWQEQIQLAFRAGLELGASELQVQRPNHSTTPPCLYADWVLLKLLYKTRFTSKLYTAFSNDLAIMGVILMLR